MLQRAAANIDRTERTKLFAFSNPYSNMRCLQSSLGWMVCTFTCIVNTSLILLLTGGGVVPPINTAWGLLNHVETDYRCLKELSGVQQAVLLAAITGCWAACGYSNAARLRCATAALACAASGLRLLISPDRARAMFALVIVIVVVFCVCLTTDAWVLMPPWSCHAVDSVFIFLYPSNNFYE